MKLTLAEIEDIKRKIHSNDPFSLFEMFYSLNKSDLLKVNDIILISNDITRLFKDNLDSMFKDYNNDRWEAYNPHTNEFINEEVLFKKYVTLFTRKVIEELTDILGEQNEDTVYT